MATSNTERKIRQFLDEPMRPGDPRIRPKGTLLIIGGHEDKENEKVILRELARRVGSGKLVIAPIASERPNEMWEMYETVMRGLGVRHVHHLRIEAREDGASVRAMKTLEDATAVFFTGGDQMRITSMIGDTPAFSRICEIFVEGGTIAGTSAGASVLSETMMVSGNGEASHRIDANLQLAPGFGFARDMVIDQHFAERGRINRLLGVVAQNPRVLGIGIDENTAIELDVGVSFRVFGEGGVTVLNGATVTMTNIAEEDRDRTMSIYGVTLHVLSQGDRFDLRTRTPRLGRAHEIEDELGIEVNEDSAAADD
jgi:cyanophycinase